MNPTFTRYRLHIDTRLKLQAALLLNQPVMSKVNFLLVLGGICAFICFNSCDLIASRDIANKNQIASYWMLSSHADRLPGLSGLTLASVLAFGLVTHSHGILNCKRLILNEILLLVKAKTTRRVACLDQSCSDRSAF